MTRWLPAQYIYIYLQLEFFRCSQGANLLAPAATTLWKWRPEYVNSSWLKDVRELRKFRLSYFVVVVVAVVVVLPVLWSSYVYRSLQQVFVVSLDSLLLLHRQTSRRMDGRWDRCIKIQINWQTDRRSRLSTHTNVRARTHTHRHTHSSALTHTLSLTDI